MADQAHASDTTRGQEAAEPQQIPARGWKDVAVRAWREVSENNIFLAAGGVTYAVLLALFPALAACVSLYGLVLDPNQIEHQVGSMSGILPPDGQKLLGDQLHQLVSAPNGALGFTAILALLFALWSASRGMSGLISALNMAYQEKEKRGFFRFNLVAIGLTLGLIVGGLIAIALVAVLPAAVGFLDLGSFAKWLILILEWPLLLAVVMIGLAVLYRYAPSRDSARWHWISPGAIVGTALWIIGSIGFSVYLANFNNYNKTYGSLGGVVILLTWLYLSSFIVLFGAVINAEAERQTRKDTTEGEPQPMGQRGAHAADTVGDAPPR
jgi:membrane protein